MNQPETLFGRKCSLIAYNVRHTFQPPFVPVSGDFQIVLPGINTTTPSDGIDLSEMHITFRVLAPDSSTPKNAIIRVFNLSDGAPDQAGRPTKNTVAALKNQYGRVVLQAGYENGPFGVIFDGTIKQVRNGRLNATDTFCDIYAGDGDIALSNAVVAASIAAGKNNPQGRAGVIGQALSAYGVTLDPTQLSATGGIIPRGKVLFGMARDLMRSLANDQQVSWHVENGKVIIVPLTSYLPGEAIVLTSRSGMIEIPDITEDGIHVKALLNPKIRVGGLLKIDNASINTVTVREQGFPNFASVNFFANESADGTYKTLVIEHEGDTRGEPWWTNMTCLSVDLSAPTALSVKPFG